MENKQKKKSINTVIYLLLCVMLASVVLVSAFTVASRRGRGGQGDGTDSSTSGDSTVTDSADSTADSASTTTADSDNNHTTNDKNPTDTTDGKKTNADTSEDEKPASADIRYFVIPAVGNISKEFEIDVPVYSLTMNDYRAHTGVDIAANLGEEVIASSGGVVSKIWNDPMMGSSITIDHGDNIYTTYKNLAPGSTDSLSVGDRVMMGQTIGAIGESALIEIAEEPHVHVEMTVDGSYVDPLEYMSVSMDAANIYED